MMISDTNKSKLRNKKINSKLQKKEKDELVIIMVLLHQTHTHIQNANTK